MWSHVGKRLSLVASTLLCCRALVTTTTTRRKHGLRRTLGRSSVGENDYDVIIIGSGIGGLCAGALLAEYGRSVLVCESHEHVGGVAHAFQRGGYTLDSGPSLWSGCSVPSTNPLRQVMDATGCSVDWLTYNGWGLHDLEKQERWRMTVGDAQAWEAVVAAKGDVKEWQSLLSYIEPVVDASMACPPMALRGDTIGFTVKAFLPYLLPAVFRASLKLGVFVPDLLTGAASQLLGSSDSFTRRWVDYLAFAISGLPANGTVGAAVAYTLGDLHHDGAFLDYPRGGSGAVAEALAATIADRPNCEVRVRAHVEEILLGDKVRGVRLRDGSVAKADVVISNADLWNTVELIPQSKQHDEWRQERAETVPTPSFVHLWVGFDKEGLPADLDVHHSVFNKGFSEEESAIDARRGMHIISIPSLIDPDCCPEGKHVAHVYAAANEPYEAWANLTKTQYAEAKEKAAEPLWKALEAVIPDVRSRAELVVVGTPLTHARFNRRYKGSYGPAGLRASGDLLGFADGKTPIRGLYTVGDGNFPGIGVPAAAASAILVANSLVSIKEHSALLDRMRTEGTLQSGKEWWGQNPKNFHPGGRIAVHADLDTLGTRTNAPQTAQQDVIS